MRIAHILVCHSVSPFRLFASIPRRENACWYVFLHGPSKVIEDEARIFCEERGGQIFPIKRNRGLALSWNDAVVAGIRDGCEAFLFLNDDLFFYDFAYARFLDAIYNLATNDPDNALITVQGLESGCSPLAGQIHAQSFACGALSMSAIKRIGFFDENFIPAYYEDTDYFIRISKAGMRVHVVEDVWTEHERSATSRIFSSRDTRLLREAFARNENYILRKWGSKTPVPQFEHPFNDERFDHRIVEECRHAPYGNHDIIPEVRSSYIYREPA